MEEEEQACGKTRGRSRLLEVWVLGWVLPLCSQWQSRIEGQLRYIRIHTAILFQ